LVFLLEPASAAATTRLTQTQLTAVTVMATALEVLQVAVPKRVVELKRAVAL
jgi:hypothetical protein